VLAAAWEVIWWKIGDIGKPIKAAPGTHQLSVKQVQPQPKALEPSAQKFDVPGLLEEQRGRKQKGKNVDDVKPDSVKQAKAAARLAAMLSGWCPISQVVVKGSPLDHFAIRLEQDTIAFTEATRFFVQAKDVNDQDIELDPNTLLNLLVVTNEEYGTFIDKQGDTLKTGPVKLKDIPYGDAKDGLIRFAAVKKNPISLEVCRMRTELQSDATKKGEKDVTVLEQTLKIVMTAPYEVQPVIPPTIVDEPSTENRKEFTIRLTRGGKPVANDPFRLTTDYIDRSGGHDHVDPRRTENRENYGHFILRRTQGQQNRPYDGQTQANGREEFDYVASIFGDRMLLRVDSRRNPLLWDTLSVAEKVPDLQLLGDGANYVKVGGTCEHHGPSDRLPANSACQRPDQNHWATAATNQAIANISEAYRREFPSLPTLAINDMSLPLGGRFDINGRWVGNTRHEFHRRGLDVDIRSSSSTMPGDRYVDVNRSGAFDPGIDRLAVDHNGNRRYDNVVHPRFQTICLRDGAQRVRLEFPGQAEEHFHVYFWRVDAQ
jgi:hypothetical protein